MKKKIQGHRFSVFVNYDSDVMVFIDTMVPVDIPDNTAKTRLLLCFQALERVGYDYFTDSNVLPCHLDNLPSVLLIRRYDDIGNDFGLIEVLKDDRYPAGF